MRSTPFGGALVTPAISKLDVATELPSNLLTSTYDKFLMCFLLFLFLYKAYLHPIILIMLGQ
jgi:hypothetical protein